MSEADAVPTPKRMLPVWVTAEVLWGFVVFLTCWGMTLLFNQPVPRKGNLHFAWEYGNIAAALISGRGFSDPFDADTGATAWMPPVLPAWMALVFGIFGIRTVASLWLLLFGKCAVLAVCSVLIMRAAGLRSHTQRGLWVVLFVAYLVSNRWSFFENFHDEWVAMLALSWGLWIAVSPGGVTSAHSRIWGFLAPAAAPISAWSVLLVLFARAFWPTNFGIRAEDVARYRRGTGVIVLFFSLSLGGWMARNTLTLGQPYLVKSNLWFDFYQANVVDEDGIPSDALFTRNHPAVRNATQELYMQHGEAAFMDRHRQLAREAWSHQPGHYLSMVLNRARNAFIYLQSQHDMPAYGVTVSPKDREALRKAGLMYVSDHGQAWACLDMSERHFSAALAAVALTDEDAVRASWLVQKRRIETHASRPERIVWGLCMAGVPALCLAWLFLIGRRDPLIRVLFVLYVLQLTPYVLISHYERYQVALVGLHALILWLTGQAVWAHVRRGSTSQADGSDVRQETHLHQRHRLIPSQNQAPVTVFVDAKPRTKR